MSDHAPNMGAIQADLQRCTIIQESSKAHLIPSISSPYYFIGLSIFFDAKLGSAQTERRRPNKVKNVHCGRVTDA